jgi:glycosyltransferase involved in cell wall biosynthesis
MPHISVILPTYNRAHLLGRAVQSVLQQTYRDLELIVVDDGSADETPAVVGQYTDARLHYVRHATRQGAAAARNTGVRVSRGTYLAFQDSDDEWLPSKLARQLDVFLRAGTEPGIVYCRFWDLRGRRALPTPSALQVARSRLPGARNRLSGDISTALLYGNWVTPQTVIMPRVCFDAVGGFDTSFRQFEDWDFFLRLARHFRFLYLNQTLVRTYFTPGSVSVASEKLVPSLEQLVRKHAPAAPASNPLLAQYQYALGCLACQQQQCTQGAVHFMRAVRLCPHNATYWLSALAASAGYSVYLRVAQRVGGY